jgi:serine protease AprX
MKRALLALLLSACLLSLLCAGLPVSSAGRAETKQGVQPANKTAADLRRKINVGQGRERVRVIIQPAKGRAGGALDDALEGNGASNVGKFHNLDFRVATLPVAAAAALAARADVAYVSLDHNVGRLGHVSLTTGADAVRTNNGTTTSGLDGTGIGIAVLDSGIDMTHRAFLDKSNYISRRL